jgi:hypothetical protein
MLMDVVLPVQTSLLQAILRELPLVEGTIEVGGTISYASQEPWMFAGSLRQNILFGQPLVRERYAHVVHVCALKRDFLLLPYADKTIVGERGVSLSGGQRARANLARYVDFTFYHDLSYFIAVKVILLQCKSDIEVEYHAFLYSFGIQLHAPIVTLHRENSVHISSVLCGPQNI